MENVTYYSPDNVSGILLGPHAGFSVFATILVGLRMLVARGKASVRWAPDECVSIAALVANNLMLIAEGISSTYGLGSDMVTISTEFPHGTIGFLKCIMAIEVCYGVACPLSKMSVLMMYHRIFSAAPVIHYLVWAIGSGLVGWGIAVVVVSIFSCTPVAGFWDSTIESSCVNSTNFYIGITVPNIVFDLLTVALPIREVWKLQMGQDRKMAIICVFLLGGSVVLASIARLVLFVIYLPGVGASGNNISQTVVIPHTASAVETCLAIVAANLPPCAPVLRRIFVRVFGSVTNSEGSARSGSKLSKNLNTLITIGKISNKGPKRANNNRDTVGSFEQLDDDTSLQGSTDELYTPVRRKTVKQGASPLHGIQGQHSLRVEESGNATNTGIERQVLSDIPLRDLSAK